MLGRMSSTPKESLGATSDETSPTMPAPMDDRGLTLTIVAFVVFIVTWIGAKSVEIVSSTSFGGSDLGLLQIGLVLVAGAAALTVGRTLKSIPRTVFIVITVFYFVCAALTAIFTEQFTSLDVESRFFAILRLLLYIADVVYPLVIAQVLAVTISRVPALPAAADEADIDDEVVTEGEEAFDDAADAADTAHAGDERFVDDEAVTRLATRTARSGTIAATVLFAAVAVFIVTWLLSLSLTVYPLVGNSRNVAFAIAAGVCAVVALFALRAIAVTRALPVPAPVVGQDTRRRRPRLAHIFTFLTIAAGLCFCQQYTLITVGFGVGAMFDSDYTFGPLAMLVFIISSIVLAIITIAAVTQHRTETSDSPR